jgi:putative FmdB family regulatory protein
MPIYAYKCGSCGHAKDVLQRLSDAPLVVCPACGAASFAKQVTAAGFQLKGSGWYATDFRGGNKNAAAGADAAKNGDGAKTGEGTRTEGATKPAETAAKPVEGSSSVKSDAPKASAGGCGCH